MDYKKNLLITGFLPKKAIKTLIFSSITIRAIAGFGATLALKPDKETCTTRNGFKTLLFCRVLFLLKRVFSKNERFNRYFPGAWTPFPLELSGMWKNKAIGARTGPGFQVRRASLHAPHG